MYHNYIKNIASLLVDVEGAQIPVSAATVQLNCLQTQVAPVIRNSRSIAEIEQGKFRRLFNRHRQVYR